MTHILVLYEGPSPPTRDEQNKRIKLDNLYTNSGYPPKYKFHEADSRICMYLEFESEEEAVIFKLVGIEE